MPEGQTLQKRLTNPCFFKKSKSAVGKQNKTLSKKSSSPAFDGVARAEVSSI